MWSPAWHGFLKKNEKVLQRLPNARIGNWMRSTVLECLWTTMKPDISLSQLGSVRRHLRSRCLFQWRLGLDPLGLVDCYQCVGGDESQSGSPTFERRTSALGGECEGMGWNGCVEQNQWRDVFRETRVFSFYGLLASLPNTTNTPHVVKSEIRTWEDHHFGFGDHITLRDDNTSWQS